MVEETIKTIKETENEAEEMIKKADAQCTDILEQASVEARELKEQAEMDAKAKAEAALAAAKEAADHLAKQKAVEVEQETAAMRDVALGKEKEAVQAVMQALV
ncbi:hypothetical protein [Dorea sp. ICN-14282]|uniref:hypothetical protein n=1 Tax=Dorea sp. ICN-14282 TaxID=3134654 RepID=UPI0030BB0CE0